MIFKPDGERRSWLGSVHDHDARDLRISQIVFAARRQGPPDTWVHVAAVNLRDLLGYDPMLEQNRNLVQQLMDP